MEALVLLGVLICPITMGAMLLYMRRSHARERMRDGEPDSGSLPTEER